jgi:hypothetical protein
MKRKLLFGVAFLMVLALVACAASFNQIVYREQATSLSGYKIINGTFMDLRSQGLITDEGWKKYADLANKFLDSHKNVSTAMVAYVNNQTTQGTVELAQKAMVAAMDVLKKYYFDTIPKDKQKPLF